MVVFLEGHDQVLNSVYGLNKTRCCKWMQCFLKALNTL